MVWISREYMGKLAEYDWLSTVNDLIVSPKYASDDERLIELWEKTDTHVGMPVSYGLKFVARHKLPLADRRSMGAMTVYPRCPVPRDEKQAKFFKGLVTELKGKPTVLGRADTGAGKTVGACYSAYHLRRCMLVIVPSKNLAHQWYDEVLLHLGLPPEKVHIFEEGKCEWQGKAVVIAVIHNLIEYCWPEEFYQHFGLVVWDEAHRVAAKSFSQTIKQFPARYRLALTATPERRDGCTGIITTMFGDVNEDIGGSDVETMPVNCYIYRYNGTPKFRKVFNPAAKLAITLNGLVAHDERNMLLARIIQLGHRRGRHILALSDRVQHLQRIKFLLVSFYGVDESKIGIFAATVDGRKTRQEELQRIKDECDIILGTYGMMKEAQNVPRLDMGVDLTPRVEAIQVLGRIRRLLQGKKIPIWITVLDVRNKFLMNIAGARLKDYKKAGAKIFDVASQLIRIPF